MDFGKEKDGIALTELELPPEPSENVQVLKKSKAKTSLYVGLPKWTQGPWTKSFYPTKVKPTNYLKYYASQISCIELNATRYWSHYNSGQVKKWTSLVGPEFKFCPKFFERISHGRKFNYEDFLNIEFRKSLEGFGKFLGPAFLQLPASFSPKRAEELFSFLELYANNYSLALELRHPAWFTNQSYNKELREFLIKKNIAFIITDAPANRTVLHRFLTCEKTFIRFCLGLSEDENKNRLEKWAECIHNWTKMGLKEVYFFIHHPEEESLVEAMSHFIECLNKKGHNIIMPSSSSSEGPQTSMF